MTRVREDYVQEAKHVQEEKERIQKDIEELKTLRNSKKDMEAASKKDMEEIETLRNELRQVSENGILICGARGSSGRHVEAGAFGLARVLALEVRRSSSTQGAGL